MQEFAIEGYSGYRFLEDGTVLTRWRSGKGKPWVLADEWVPINGTPDTLGYFRASFRSDAGTTRFDYVHRVIAEAYYGPPPKGQEVCHENDTKTDNSLRNLSYGTRKRNVRDAFGNRRLPSGERHSRATLTDSQVRSIRSRFESGERQRDLAKEFGVSAQRINNVVHYRNWRWLTPSDSTSPNSI